jgi:hypothetical protein
MRSLHQVVLDRAKIAKDFTDPFIKEVELAIKEYKASKFGDDKKDNTVYDKHLTKNRYSFRVPYIFVTHESQLSSLYEKPFELIYNGKGMEDDEKRKLVEFVYKYLYDKLDMEEKLETLGWWFLLVGFVSTYQDYRIEIEEEVEVMQDENGEPVMAPVYAWHDPDFKIDNPLKTYFSPDSEFSADGAKIPYLVREKTMDVDEIEEIYGKTVEADEELDVTTNRKLTDDQKSDIKRAKVYYYTGRLPSEIKEQLQKEYNLDWKYRNEYLIVTTEKMTLSVAKQKKRCTLARFYADESEMFGFGLAKTLKDIQKEMSIRRGQMVRYADMHTFPWLAISAEAEVDTKGIQDIQRRKPLVYRGEKPEYIVPPPLPAVITQADEIARSDAQFISGTLDISKGAQESNTVKTATGQQMFAQSQDKRMQKARRAIARSFRQVVINLFELFRENAEDGKIMKITDDNGSEREMVYSKELFDSIDFDSDIDISIDSISENQQTVAAREISLYEKTIKDPMFNARKIKEEMLRNGFKKKNPSAYLLSEEEMQMQQQPPEGEMPQEPQMPADGSIPMPEFDMPDDQLGSLPQDAPQIPDLTGGY